VGFALNPTLPYAWQAARDIIEIPTHPYVRITDIRNNFGRAHLPYLFRPYLLLVDQVLVTHIDQQELLGYLIGINIGLITLLE
jgi:hypothetical protein